MILNKLNMSQRNTILIQMQNTNGNRHVSQLVTAISDDKPATKKGYSIIKFDSASG
jgi:hypothetical protein